MPEQGKDQAILKENTLGEQKQNPELDILEILKLKKKIITFSILGNILAEIY